MKIVTTPIIVVIGVIGNTLSFLVMKSKPLRHKSYSHYLCALSLFDTLTLLTRFTGALDEYYIHESQPGLFNNFTDVTCKLYNFFAHVVALMSAWIVTLMAIERLIAVCLPFKKTFLRTQCGSVTTIVILLCCVCTSQAFRLFMIKHVIYDKSHSIKDCLASEEYVSIYTGLQVYYYLWTLIFILPVGVVLVCNSLVLRQILRVRREFYRETNSTVNRTVRQRQRSTYMLLFVTFAYVFTLLPMFLLTFIIDLSIKVQSKERAGHIFVVLSPFLNLTECIALINYGMNFFIYVVSGKSFRFQLRRTCVFTKRLMEKRTFGGRTRSTREDFLRLQ